MSYVFYTDDAANLCTTWWQLHDLQTKFDFAPGWRERLLE